MGLLLMRYKKCNLEGICSRRSYRVVIFHTAAAYANGANNIAFFVFQQHATGKGNKSAVGMFNIKKWFPRL